LTASGNLYPTDGFIYTLSSTKYGIKIMTQGDGVLIYIQKENQTELKKNEKKKRKVFLWRNSL